MPAGPSWSQPVITSWYQLVPAWLRAFYFRLVKFPLNHKAETSVYEPGIDAHGTRTLGLGNKIYELSKALDRRTRFRGACSQRTM